MDFHLSELEQKSTYILREARAKFKNIAVLWSMGKDSSACLYLCRKTFFGKIPFTAVHIDNGQDFPETYEFRDKLVKEWGINLLIAKAEMKKDEISGTVDGLSKVEALKKITDERGFDALIVPIRRDSHESRAKENYFSPRDKDFRWDPNNKPPINFDSMADFKGAGHVRVHPFLDWTELDIWRYIKDQNIPVSPLYFAKDGKRYRSIGYKQATLPVDSNAKTVDEIIKELETTTVPERQGRVKDGKGSQTLQRLRELGYL